MPADDAAAEAAPAAQAVLEDSEVERLVRSAIAGWSVGGRRVLVVVPDRTRSGPIAAMYRLVSAGLAEAGAGEVSWLIALGTHRRLERQELEAHLGVCLDEKSRTPRGERVLNHAWEDPGDLLGFGTVPASAMAELSGGRLCEDVPVRANAEIARHDLAVVVGPVFPHEVVGFSGGNKYFFPGISGAEMIDASHWLGALITSREIIGRPGVSPVRAMIDGAAALLPLERRCLAMVVAPEGQRTGRAGRLAGLFAGSCEDAWRSAAELSGKVHIRRVPRPFERVVAVMPTRYEDMWTAAKGMYKLEPVVADGGEVIIYAPHIRQFSTVHGADLAGVGYHCRDYFLAQWDRFSKVPLSVLAHSTHLRGQGSYDVAKGAEQGRITVRLATGIDRATCEAMSLAYGDPASIDRAALEGEPGTLVVTNAGEILYRLEDEVLTPWPLTAALAGSGGAK